MRRLDSPEKIIAEGNMFEIVHQDFDLGSGKIKTFEFARRSPGTRAIVKNAVGEILMTREYRLETQGFDYRLPGGKVFDTREAFHAWLATGKDIAQYAMIAAEKEVREETGIIVENSELFLISPAGASVIWDLYYFTASSTENSVLPELEDGEDISHFWVKKDELQEIMLTKMSEDRSIGVLYKWLGRNSGS